MKSLRLIILVVITLSIIVPVKVAAVYSSSGYQTNEYFFGTGGDVQLSSPNYQAQGSVGALGVGNYSSATYQTYAGFLTPNEPFLEMSISTSLVDLGVLDTGSPKTGTADFYVRAYTDSGYTVQTVSQTPSYTSGGNTHYLAPMDTSCPCLSSTGTEQFGINLKANALPVAFGSDPSPQPDGNFATGVAASGYDQADHYKYHAGDVIAETPSGSSGWGQTNYTISYVANISSLTPAGDYTMVHDLVVVATY